MQAPLSTSAASLPIGDAMVLSDGVMNLTLLNFAEGAKSMA